jgi:hypothetical protein
MKKLIFVLTLGLVLGLVSSAFATEPLLSVILNTIYGAVNYVPILDSSDQLWNSTTAGNAYAEAKFASWPQTFGYIDSALVFHALMGPVTGSNYLYGSPSASFSAILGTFQLADQAKKNATTTYTWGSLPSYNTDGLDHMRTYRITGNASKPANVIGDYVIGWEDTLGGGDKDYQDFVVQIHGLAPVPEPTSMLLLGMGILGLLGIKRRKVI